jgi:hypothetical protein
MRMEERDPAKKVLCTKPGGNEDRRRGRPKLRMCDELEEVVARAGCRTWRINAQARTEWRKLIGCQGQTEDGRRRRTIILVIICYLQNCCLFSLQ